MNFLKHLSKRKKSKPYFSLDPILKLPTNTPQSTLMFKYMINLLAQGGRGISEGVVEMHFKHPNAFQHTHHHSSIGGLFEELC